MALPRPILRRLLLSSFQTVILDDRGSWSGFKLWAAAGLIAKQLKQQTQADQVGILLPTSGGYAAAVLGCWCAGKVPVPLNYLLKREDLHYVIDDAGIDTVVTANVILDALGEDLLPESVNQFKLDTMAKPKLPPLTRAPAFGNDDLATLIYTSGTSGKPKGVKLSHGNLEADAKACIEHAGLDHCSSFLGVLPQFHSFGLTVMTLIPMFLGAKAVYTARFIPRKLIELMKEHQPTVFVAVPSMYGAMGSVKSAEPETFKNVKYLISGAEPLPSSIRQKYRDQFEVELFEGYGLTETSPVTHWSTTQHNRSGSVGKALPGVRTYILDENDQPLGRDEDGEIALAGPMVMLGYHNRPDENAKVFLELDPSTATDNPGAPGQERVFRTGDIGRVDAEGFLKITGRKKEMIIVGGENVFPREIEEVLNHHPAVHASAVIGRPDDLRGEVPIAFVELEEGAEFDPKSIREQATKELLPFKVPKEVNLLEKLPRSPTGKILRKDLPREAPVGV